MPDATHEQKLLMGAQEWVLEALEELCREKKIRFKHVADDDEAFRGLHNVICMPWSEPERARTMQEISLLAEGGGKALRPTIQPFYMLARQMLFLRNQVHVLQQYLEEEEHLDADSEPMRTRIERIINVEAPARGQVLSRELVEMKKRLGSERFVRECKRGEMAFSVRFTKVRFVTVRLTGQPPQPCISFEYLYTTTQYTKATEKEEEEEEEPKAE